MDLPKATQSVWRCLNCGVFERPVGSAWRWLDGRFQHACGYPQGHSDGEPSVMPVEWYGKTWRVTIAGDVRVEITPAQVLAMRAAMPGHDAMARALGTLPGSRTWDKALRLLRSKKLARYNKASAQWEALAPEAAE